METTKSADKRILSVDVLRNLIDFGDISKKLVGGDLAILAGEQWAYLLANIVSLGLSLLLLKFMYDRKIFLKA